MLSLQKIATVKSAVVTSLHPELKREILCAPGSEYDVTKSEHQFSRKQQWNDIISKKAREILSRQTLPEDLVDKVVALLPAVGLKMLIWAEYHEGTLRLPRDLSLQFLRYSHFTERGVVDTGKAAEDLMNLENLDPRQKYKIACMYFFEDHIGRLYEEIVRRGIGGYNAVRWLEKPDVVKFWTSVQSGEIFRTLPRALLHTRKIWHSVGSGCKPAVQRLWEKSEGNECLFIESTIAPQVHRRWRPGLSDWIVFRDRRYDDVVEAWVPADYYEDTFRFIFSKMIELQRQGLVQLGYINDFAKRCVFLRNMCSALDLFLCWPHQDDFLETALVMWECMSGKTYNALLLKICENIEPRKNKNIRYGEEKCYDYRYLLKEFWCKSPDRCKRYVSETMDTYLDFVDHDRYGWIWMKRRLMGILFEQNNIPINEQYDRFVKSKNILLLKLLYLKKFTQEDEENIRSILSFTTDEEMSNVMTLKFWKISFRKVMCKEKFEIFDRFLRVCFQSKVKAEEFRGKLQLKNEARRLCRYFVKYNKLNAIQSLIERISLTEKEIERLKIDTIYSLEGKFQCWELIWSEGSQALEKFITWFLPSGKKAEVFKRKLAERYCNSCKGPHLEENKIFELVKHFAKSNNADENHIQQFKESVAHVLGVPICEKLISSHSSYIVGNFEDSSLHVRSDFRGGQWSKVDTFLSSLLAPNKIVDFKKRIYDKDAVRILASLIKAKQWSEADKFCEWLELPESEIRCLKKKMLTAEDGTWSMFHYLVFTVGNEANKLEKIEAMLRWHLTDAKDVLTFRDTFLQSHVGYGEAALDVFRTVIDKYRGELAGQKRVREGELHSRNLKNDGCVKRKSGTCPPKKACLPRPRGKKKQEEKPVRTERRRSQRLLNKADKI